jgi:hypothetical protein
MELGSAVYTKDKSHFQVVAEKRKIYSAALESLEKMETDQAGKDLINKFKTTIAGGKEGSMAMMKAVEAGNFEEAANIFRNVMTRPTRKNYRSHHGACQIPGERCSCQVQGHPDGKHRPCAHIAGIAASLPFWPAPW